jgi:hypothetical protein
MLLQEQGEILLHEPLRSETGAYQNYAPSKVTYTLRAFPHRTQMEYLNSRFQHTHILRFRSSTSTGPAL